MDNEPSLNSTIHKIEGSKGTKNGNKKGRNS